jgi:hypothetical protein
LSAARQIKKSSGEPPSSTPKRRQQRPALRRRQGVRRFQERAQQLMQAGERQPGFGFDAGRPQDKIPALPPATGRRLDQNGLADARLTADRQGAAGLGRRIDGRGQDLKLGLATNDLKRRLAHRRSHPLSVLRQQSKSSDPWRAAIRHPIIKP